MDARYDETLFLVVCRVLCAKVVGATSSEGFLVLIGFEFSSMITVQKTAKPTSSGATALHNVELHEA